MSDWLLKRIQESENDYPNPKYAFNSTVNWMRSLKVICESSINEKSLKDHYKEIKRSNNQEYTIKAIASLLSSFNYLRTLKSLSSNDLKRNSTNSHVAIVSWYYCIYNASKAIISACNNSYQENHTKTANVFQNLVEEQKLILSPFDLFLSDLTVSSVDEQITKYRNGLEKGKSLPSDYYPQNHNNALDCVFSYLKGTANYVKKEEEEKLKGSKDFKNKGFENFKTKESRGIRDQALKKKKINFLSQAFRYRGKANYRDCVYFLINCEDYRNGEENFISDLGIVAENFLIMTSYYLSKRSSKDDWQSFISNSDNELKLFLNNKINFNKK